MSFGTTTDNSLEQRDTLLSNLTQYAYVVMPGVATSSRMRILFAPKETGHEMRLRENEYYGTQQGLARLNG
ncbi:hypothetical protein Pr1d_50770 [Bythopirellula goksoeyrii]|uniref:Uncharacterized protein n=1 Tax=Bythopirellula goksoeyrii TaxID=1400387 RepID=A0A5B9QJH1_9BACT|nr:hypothetical protein Pr1d_50770 [Bythopirellula goksoeyrii]